MDWLLDRLMSAFFSDKMWVRATSRSAAIFFGLGVGYVGLYHLICLTLGGLL